MRCAARRPTFTVAAVVTLAVGIGATTAIFSVVYSVLIKPLPYPNSDELVRIRHANNRGDLTASSTMYLTYGDENRTFAHIGLWRQDSATLTERGPPARVRALRVSHGTLQALGVQPMRGRWFTEQEHDRRRRNLRPSFSLMRSAPRPRRRGQAGRPVCEREYPGR